VIEKNFGGLIMNLDIILIIVLILIMAASIIMFYKFIRAELPQDAQKKKTYKQARNGLVWTGTIITIICNVIVQKSDSDIVYWVASTIGFISLVLALYGCYYWAKYKSRRGWWALFGILTLLGYIVLMALSDKNKDLNVEEEQKKFGIYDT
jgi:cytochrome bd-type quinol oxidase subunit 2